MKWIFSNIKNSAKYSFAIVSGASTIAGLWGYTIRDINAQWEWWKPALILLGLFVLFCIIIYFILAMKMKYYAHKPYTAIINGKTIEIKVSDIFQESGLKVIPFNEKFDTQVDDIIISHESLNGQMIDSYVDNKQELASVINSAPNENSAYKPKIKNGEYFYPLGRLIKYKDFALLSFSHFNEQNEANIGIGEYEQLLFVMWKEMRRIYASEHIVLPLLGAGITTIEGIQEKNFTAMLKCILCTLRNSNFQPSEGITIVLTEETIKGIDMNEIRESF